MSVDDLSHFDGLPANLVGTYHACAKFNLVHETGNLEQPVAWRLL
jgi:hypothetical protein